MVHRCREASGRDLARKTFVGEPAAKLVNYLLTGAPNPYGWCEAAAACAVHRREVVAELVDYWFGSRLSVARALRRGWNAEHRAHEIDLEFVDGRPPALRHPFSPAAGSEARALRRELLRPLLLRLDEAGLDGQAWQAGRGNPVGLANFLLREDGSWAWVDLESGVPALAPADPIQLVTFYLPRSWRHRRPLFDDIDVGRLRSYVAGQDLGLRRKLGDRRRDELDRSIDALERSQEEWRSLTRVRRSIGYRLARGAIDRKQADWYAQRPVRWYARELARAVPSLARRLSGALAWLARQLRSFDYRAAARAAARFLGSQAYRAKLARLHVRTRIRSWEERGQLAPAEAATLRERVEADAITPFIADFGVHLGVKPLMKTVQWLVVPALFAAGLIGAVGASIAVVFGGAIARTLYTFGRTLQCLARGEPAPWVALAAGALPVTGNAAFPLEILRRGSVEGGEVARFIIGDTVTFVGEKLPVWGGRDTGTEHLFNEMGDRLLRWCSKTL